MWRLLSIKTSLPNRFIHSYNASFSQSIVIRTLFILFLICNHVLINASEMTSTNNIRAVAAGSSLFPTRVDMSFALNRQSCITSVDATSVFLAIGCVKDRQVVIYEMVNGLWEYKTSYSDDSIENFGYYVTFDKNDISGYETHTLYIAAPGYITVVYPLDKDDWSSISDCHAQFALIPDTTMDVSYAYFSPFLYIGSPFATVNDNIENAGKVQVIMISPSREQRMNCQITSMGYEAHSPAPVKGGRFGASLDVSLYRVAIGAPHDLDSKQCASGKVYVYDFSDTSFSKAPHEFSLYNAAEITDADCASSPAFGTSVALIPGSTTWFVAGSPRTSSIGQVLKCEVAKDTCQVFPKSGDGQVDIPGFGDVVSATTRLVKDGANKLLYFMGSRINQYAAYQDAGLSFVESSTSSLTSPIKEFAFGSYQMFITDGVSVTGHQNRAPPTFAPTPIPTAAPTIPTASPTIPTPTERPTDMPTSRPTSQWPTRQPTPMPTKPPTFAGDTPPYAYGVFGGYVGFLIVSGLIFIYAIRVHQIRYSKI